MATYSNMDAKEGFALHSFDMSRYAGGTLRIQFVATENEGGKTFFVVDDVNPYAQ